MSEIKIAPSILGTPSEECPKIVEKLISDGADLIHYDVMDGRFVMNVSFSAKEFSFLRKNTSKDIFYDVHLMVENVKEEVKAYLDGGADLVTFHYEAVKKEEISSIASYVHGLGKKVGISVKPNTPVEVLEPYLNQFDLILVMSVEPGKGGQKFNEAMLSKVTWLKNKRKEKNLSYVIEIDGGINAETFKLAKAAGVDWFVAGSYILKSDNMKERINSLR